MSQRYEDPADFRQPLLARLRTAAVERGVTVQDLQRKLSIERLLARLFAEPDPPWLLKGGYAMELRYRPRARTTRDVDLTVGDPGAGDLAERLRRVREALQEAAATDLDDHFEFRVAGARRELPGAPLGGATFPVEVRIAGKLFGRFPVDVGLGDPTGAPPETLVGDDLLAFAGIAPARALAVPRAQQFAEKLHAYTTLWVGRTNTRTKDLVDLVLLIERGALEVDAVARAVRETFDRRTAHALPELLDPPPADWEREYAAMAAQVAVGATTLVAAHALLATYHERVWRVVGAEEP